MKPSSRSACGGGRVQVWGDHTFTVKEDLKSLKLRWDPDDGRKCWWRLCDDEHEKQQVLAAVQQLSCNRALQYTLTS